MKRLFIIASLAILAVGCQKTEIQNEVQNQIGFSTETGKMTRAIVQDGTYLTSQPFGVYAYGWQKIENQNTSNDDPVMDNVEIFQDDRTIDGVSTKVWVANDGLTYYWPNDPRTALNFYAYSPYIQRSDDDQTSEVDESTKAPAATAPHQFMEVTTISHDEVNGLIITGYEHENMYVDFMVATPVLGARYSDQDGVATVNPTSSVPVKFNHEMTQVIFNVKPSESYPNITFTINNITLSGIGNKADYSDADLKGTASGTTWVTPTYTPGTWETPTQYTGSYQIFPQTAYAAGTADNGCPKVGFVTQSAQVVTADNPLITEGVTMIPQTIGDNQKFTIDYNIAGIGVAEENVIKEVYFKNVAASATKVNWVNNQKITYNVIIGLNEIYFEPSVANWGSTTGNTYEFQQ